MVGLFKVYLCVCVCFLSLFGGFFLRLQSFKDSRVVEVENKKCLELVRGH